MNCKLTLTLNRIIFFFLSLLFSQSEICFSQSTTVTPKEIPSFNIKIDSIGAEHAVNSNLLGFSVENLFVEVKNTSDTAFVNPLKKINPVVLRWPGGMLSNFYHCNDYGYGLKRNEIGAIYLPYAQQLENQGVFALQLKENHPYLQDFLKLTESLKAKVLITANILTGTPEELLDQLNYFNDNNVEVVGVELGDEMYTNAYRSVFPYPGSYISKAEPFVQLVKKYFPKIKFGVCAAPNPRLSDLDGTSAGEFGYFKAWNDALSKEDFYDAIIIHSYTPIPVISNQPVDSVFHRAVTEAKKIFAKSGMMVQSLDYYHEIFPKFKIWITEWNLAIRSNNAYYLNTLFQSLYISAYLNFVNHFNSINKNPIELAVFQSLATGGVYNHYGLIDLKSEKEKSSSRIIKRTSWNAFKNLYPLFSGEYYLHPCSISSSERIEMFSYTDTVTHQLLLCWTNFSGKELKIDSLQYNHLEYETNIATVDYLKGKLSDSFGWTKFSRNSYNTPPVEKLESLKLSDWVFPPYAMGIIRIKL
ncbi:MAG: hypothetical protein WCI97_01165 [Bacteroidota bacterium]